MENWGRLNPEELGEALFPPKQMGVPQSGKILLSWEGLEKFPFPLNPRRAKRNREKGTPPVANPFNLTKAFGTNLAQIPGNKIMCRIGGRLRS